MKKLVGLWIDHSRGVMVTLEDERETITTLESGVESRRRLTGGSRSATPYGPEEIVPERTPKERRKHELHTYYQRIIKSLWDADRIYIMGPGEAPRELESEIRQNQQMAPRLVGVSRKDKMTDRQIAAAVRRRFRVKT